jgi:SAM-dependent methyltransferase
MLLATIKEKSEADGKNIAFYNKIAEDYDVILDEDSSNKVVRKRVREKLTGLIKNGLVLDFGGGTGRDLEWLVSNQFDVIFCEPSEGMRQKAIDRYNSSNLINHITFLENDKVDFASWHIEPPVSIKVDAILSDFAVFNCIANLDLLFQNLAQIIKPGGHLVALMLNPLHEKNPRWKLREYIRSFVSDRPLIKNVGYKGHQQTVYFYSRKNIKKASAPYFDMCGIEPLSEFILIHFVKNEQ